VWAVCGHDGISQWPREWMTRPSGPMSGTVRSRVGGPPECNEAGQLDQRPPVPVWRLTKDTSPHAHYSAMYGIQFTEVVRAGQQLHMFPKYPRLTSSILFWPGSKKQLT
jgi:hypothetical protein